MKVLIATGLYPPDIGGPATYTKLLEEELPARGVAVSVVAFTAVRQYPKLIRHCIYAWRLWHAAKTVDIVYALDPVSVGVPASLVARLRGKEFLLRLGGDYAWEQGRQRFGVTELLDEFVQTRQRSWRVRLLQRVQTWVAKQAKVVVVPSQYLKSIVEQWGIDSNQIGVIYSAYKPEVVHESRAELREAFGFAQPTILSAGRLVPWKGFAGLIDAFALLKQQLPDAKLVIAGDGPERQMLESHVREISLTDSVTFLGAVTRAELLRYKKAADVFALNTGYEGLSHELLEVLSVKTPIVTTNIGGNRELIVNEESGLLVSYNDETALASALDRLLTDEALRLRLNETAMTTLSSFSKDRSLTELVNLLYTVYEA